MLENWKYPDPDTLDWKAVIAAAYQAGEGECTAATLSAPRWRWITTKDGYASVRVRPDQPGNAYDFVNWAYAQDDPQGVSRIAAGDSWYVAIDQPKHLVSTPARNTVWAEGVCRVLVDHGVLAEVFIEA